MSVTPPTLLAGHMRRPRPAPLMIHANKGLSCWNAAAALSIANTRLVRDRAVGDDNVQLQFAFMPSTREGTDTGGGKLTFMEWEVIVVEDAGSTTVAAPAYARSGAEPSAAAKLRPAPRAAAAAEAVAPVAAAVAEVAAVVEAAAPVVAAAVSEVVAAVSA